MRLKNWISSFPQNYVFHFFLFSEVKEKKKYFFQNLNYWIVKYFSFKGKGSSNFFSQIEFFFSCPTFFETLEPEESIGKTKNSKIRISYYEKNDFYIFYLYSYNVDQKYKSRFFHSRKFEFSKKFFTSRFLRLLSFKKVRA